RRMLVDRPVDLHAHTTHSDGTLTPDGLVREAIGRGLGAIAITDHDTVSAVATATAAAGDAIEVIPGVELSSSAAGRSTGILGGKSEVGRR
ncbi:MAG: PHP domain-containing protein, partial [Chloroflexota bacterium]|nr:PHP domain-containing protein [Chloroflexota bacterium]